MATVISMSLSGAPDHLGDTGQHLAVIELYCYGNPEAREYLVDHLKQFDLVEKRVRADDVGVALVELAVATFLRTVARHTG